MKLVSPIDRVVVTKRGYTVEFKADEPVEVAFLAVDECLAAGCYPDKGEVVKPEEKEVLVELQGPEREAAVIEAMERLVARNGRDDFTGTGKPSIPKLTELLKFAIAAEERDRLWEKVLENLGSKEEQEDKVEQ